MHAPSIKHLPPIRPAGGGAVSSYLTATAHERLHGLFDAGSFVAFDAPGARMASPHLALFNLPAASDDGVAVGRAMLHGLPVYTAAQDGRFMGGAVGEVHGARLAGLLRRAARDRVAAVVLLIESGGVRLHEANAGLIAVSEVMRALLDARAAGVPVVALVGGANGAFGGMGIIASCANVVVMSAQARLAMSGPEVIASSHGVAEFDPRDRDLVWRTTGGKHRHLLGDCQLMVADDLAAFRQAAHDAIAMCAEAPAALTLAALEQEHRQLASRIERFGRLCDPLEIRGAPAMSDARRPPALAPQARAGAAPPGGAKTAWSTLAAALFPQGHAITEQDDFLSGAAQVDGRTVAVIGTTRHAAIGVEIALAQAQAVLRTVRDRPGRAIVLLVDTQGQRLRRRDEMLGIQRYMAHLGKCLELARRRGHRIVALVYDQALSGGFVSSGLMADACYALPDATIRVMGLAAMARITKVPEAMLSELARDNPVFAPGPENYWRMGGLEAIWHGDLASALANVLARAQPTDERAALGLARGGRRSAYPVLAAVLGDDGAGPS